MFEDKNTIDKFVRQNEPLFRKHWRFILILIAVSVLIGFGAAHFFYNEKVKTFEANIELCNRMVEDYKERLKETRPLGSSYSTLTNEELTNEALTLSNGIWQLLEWYEAKFFDIMLTKDNNARKKNDTELFVKLKAEYNKRFKAKAALLYDELILRLPENIKNAVEYDKRWLVQYPTNPLGIEAVAGHIEALARQLPNGIKYSKLSKEELVNRTYNLCKGIDMLISQYELRINQVDSNDRNKRKKLFLETKFEYQKDFRTEAILLAEGMYSKISIDDKNKIPFYNRNAFERPKNAGDLMKIRQGLLSIADKLK